MRRLAFCTLLLLFGLAFCTLASASTDILTFTFDQSDLSFSKYKGYDNVKMKGTVSGGEQGHPWLPLVAVQVAIPEWQQLEEVEVISSKQVVLPGKYRICPSQPMMEVSKVTAQKVDFIPADPSVYGLTTQYPGKLAESTNNGFLAGQHIAGLALYPLQYVPAEGKLILYTEIQVRLIFGPATRFPVPVLVRSDETAQRYAKLAQSMVVNPEDVWYQTWDNPKGGEMVDFLIIAPDITYNDVLQDLVDWKIQKGIKTEILTYDTLTSEYSGSDNAEKIRNAIKDYYSTKGTQWVLIVGDEELIPIRGAYLWSSIGGIPYYIPCQLYYSDLDGDWNADVNDWFGEFGDEVDMYPDVFVGRAPVSDTGEARTFANKTLIYEIKPPTDYLTRMLFAAAYILCPYPEFGYDGLDGAEIKKFIDSLFVPEQFTLTQLYESSENLDTTAFREALELGQNIINHDGHGNKTLINLLLCDTLGYQHFYSGDMQALTNDSLFGLFYSQSCKSAGIDTSDCIAEYWINNAAGGGIGYCGNTRSGWSSAIDILQGPAPEFDTSFFSVLFNQDVFEQGKTLAQSKTGFIPVASVPYGEGPYYRYAQYSLILLGDPTLELWTDTPATLTVSHDSYVASGAQYFVADVEEDDALVCCVNVTKTGTSMVGTAYSSGGKVLVVFDSAVSGGRLIVTVTKHNYAHYSDTLTIQTPSPAEIGYYSHTADDTVGTENGSINPGDSATVLVTLKNFGSTLAESVAAILTTADEYVDLDTAEVYFGSIFGGSTAQGQDPWVFKVDGDCPDSHVVVFKLDVKDKNDSSWTSGFELTVLKTDFILTVDDSDTDTKGVTIGDSVDFTLDLDTTGGFIWQVKLTRTKPVLLPMGLTITINPDTLTPPGQSILRFKTNGDLIPDIYEITVEGSSAAGGDSLKHDLTVTVFVQPDSSEIPVTWYVSNEGDDSLGIGTVELPFATIQNAIDTASNGDTVMVEKGVYEENIDFSGKNILVTSRYWEDSTEATVDSTVIDGTYKGSVVCFVSGEDSTAVLYGFTIRNGLRHHGAGVYIDSAGPTIEQNVITLNTTMCDSAGGSRAAPAIRCRKSSAKIIRNLIHHNYGPATILAYLDCNVQIINNTISRNPGGAISVQSNSYALIKNNIITENVWDVWIWEDSTFYQDSSGYGIDMGTGCSWDITFNDVWGHHDPTTGDTTNYFGEVDDLTDTLGNISYDPLFVDVESLDFHLSCYSPCIDSGDTADSVPPGGGDRIDMGCYEFQYASTDTICGDLDYDGCVTWRDYNFLLAYLYESGPAPNPLCIADVNCDDNVDISDLVRMQNYFEGTQSICQECCE